METACHATLSKNSQLAQQMHTVDSEANRVSIEINCNKEYIGRSRKNRFSMSHHQLPSLTNGNEGNCIRRPTWSSASSISVSVPVLRSRWVNAMLQVANSVHWSRWVLTWFSGNDRVWARDEMGRERERCATIFCHWRVSATKAANLSLRHFQLFFLDFVASSRSVRFRCFVLYHIAVFLSILSNASHETPKRISWKKKKCGEKNSRERKMKIVECGKEVLASSNEIYHLIPLQRAVHGG